MSEPNADAAGAPPAAPLTAGGLLRQARQARGLHIAALATSIKVTPRKLELLESDRFDELPGATFTRALAQTVCRTLKIDATPVLALLPPAPGHGLEQMSRGLNEPFRDRPGRSVPTDLRFLRSPAFLGVLLLLVLAAAAYFVPAGWLARQMPARADAGAVPTAVLPSGNGTSGTPGMTSETVDASTGAVPPPDMAAASSAPTVYSAPAEPVAAGPDGAPSAPVAAASAATAAVAPAASGAVPAPSLVPATALSGALRLTATAESWVQVTDRRGVSLLSRRLQAGESVNLDGASPFRLKIGNAQATQVTFKGERVDLAPVTSRDNVARLELK